LWKTTIDGTEHQLVGACNKDGNFYAVDTQPDADGNLPLVWSVAIGSPREVGETGCLSGAVYDKDPGRLFLSGNVVTQTATGTVVTGRVRQVNPATGATIWERALPANALGSGTINANGLLAYAGMNWENHSNNGIYVLDAATGQMLDTNPSLDGVNQLKDPQSATSDCPDCTYDQFAQPVWADGALWMSNRQALTPWRPTATSPSTTTSSTTTTSSSTTTTTTEPPTTTTEPGETTTTTEDPTTTTESTTTTSP
jgi:hypothetical protein